VGVVSLRECWVGEKGALQYTHYIYSRIIPCSEQEKTIYNRDSEERGHLEERLLEDKNSKSDSNANKRKIKFSIQPF
jgi:hypothetical protein